MTRGANYRKINAMLAFLFLLASSVASADALEDLVQSLRNRGVIGEDEYQRLSAKREAEKNSILSSDGGNSAQFTGRLQADYRTYSNPADASTFEMRRVYLGVKGRYWSDIRYSISAHLNDVGANGGNGALDEAWLDLPGYRQATVRLGQFYAPFSLEDANSSKYLDFMERAAIVNQSQSANDNPDKGAMLSGEPVKGYFYWLAYTNGSSLNAVNNNVAGGKETLARGVLDFAQIFEQRDAVYHLGFDYAAGRKPADLSAGAEIGSIRTEGRSWNFRPMKLTGIDNNYVRKRQDVEFALAYGPVKLQSEFIRENYSGVTLAGIAYDRTLSGNYFSFMWMVTGEKYADGYSGGSFGAIRPFSNFSLHGEGWGAWEIGIRFSRLDAGALNAGAQAGILRNAAGYASGMKESTLGVKWILNPNTRLLFNYVHSKYDQPTSGGVAGLMPVSSDYAYMLRAQFDL